MARNNKVAPKSQYNVWTTEEMTTAITELLYTMNRAKHWPER